MKLENKEIKKIAKLARLELNEAEIEMYAKQLSVVLDYVKILEEVDVEGIEETTQVTGLKNVMREDDVIDCDEETRKKLIASFPEKQGGLLKVKAVFDNVE